MLPLAVELVLQAGASLRGASAGWSLVAARLGLDVAMPSGGAVRSWLLRLGCHALTCPLPSGVGGWLVVSEPPRTDPGTEEETRWPRTELRQFGLEPDEVLHEGFEYRTLRQTAPCPDRFPRRNGVPAKRPLF